VATPGRDSHGGEGGEPPIEPLAVVGAAASSFALPVEGARLLLREPQLRRVAAAPVALAAVALIGALAAFVSFAPEVSRWIADLLPQFEPGAWFTWIWVGPGKVLTWLLGKVLFVAAGALCAVAALLLANVAAAPFHEVLSQRVERLATGSVRDDTSEGVSGVAREGVRAVGEELRRLLFFVAVWAVLTGLGIVVPGGQLVAPVAITLFTTLFLPLEYASYVLDRRRVPFARKRRWLRRHLGSALGFGGAALLLCAIPGVNILAMPVLVVSGTLLALRYPDY
jgi:CysZ protein